MEPADAGGSAQSGGNGHASGSGNPTGSGHASGSGSAGSANGAGSGTSPGTRGFAGQASVPRQEPFPGPPVYRDRPTAPWEQVAPDHRAPWPDEDGTLGGHDPFSQVQPPDGWFR